MSRPPFVFFDGHWPLSTTPSPQRFRNLDQHASELVNGEDGGEWNPASPIVLGPYTTPNLTLNTAGSVFSGDIETVKGNGRGDGLDKAGLVLLSNEHPTFQTPRERTVVVGFVAWSEATSLAVTNNPSFELDPVRFCARAIKASNSVICTVPLPLRAQHRGATLSSVDFRYAIEGARTALPPSMPRFRVIKISGDTIVSLHTAAGAYDANGWYVDQAATPGDYYNNNQTRIATFTPDQNHTNLDPTNATWAVQWRNEGGGIAPAGVGNLFMSATLHLTNIVDMRQE